MDGLKTLLALPAFWIMTSLFGLAISTSKRGDEQTVSDDHSLLHKAVERLFAASQSRKEMCSVRGSHRARAKSSRDRLDEAMTMPNHYV